MGSFYFEITEFCHWGGTLQKTCHLVSMAERHGNCSCEGHSWPLIGLLICLSCSTPHLQLSPLGSCAPFLTTFLFLSFLPRSCCVCLYIFPLPGLSSLVVFFSLLSLFGGPQGSHDFNYYPHVNGPQVSLWFTLISSSLLGIFTWMTHMFS